MLEVFVDQISKWSNVAIALLTAALAFTTWILARETRRMRAHGIRPHVVVTIEPHPNYMQFFNLVVENVGQGAAFDVRTSFDPDIEYRHPDGSRRVSGASIASPKILKPGERLVQFLSKHDEIVVRRSNIHVECKDVEGATHATHNVIDLDVYKTLSTLGTDNIEKIAKSVDDVSQILRRVTTFNTIKIDVFTAKDRARERAEIDRHLEERRARQRDSDPSS